MLELSVPLMVHIALALPDWSSLDSVRRAHSDLEAGALVFFALLVVFDVLAHLTKNQTKEKLFTKIGLGFFAIAVFAEMAAYPYGQRNDTLSEQIIGSLDSKAKEASAKASDALADSANALTNSGNALSEAGDAENKAGSARDSAANASRVAGGARTEAEVLHHQLDDDVKTVRQYVRLIGLPRSLSSDAMDINAASFTDLKKYAGTMAIIQTMPNDNEAIGLAKQIQGLLTNAGWHLNPMISSSDVLVPPGVWLISMDERPMRRFPQFGGSPQREESKSWLATSALANLLLINLRPNEEGIPPGLFRRIEPNDGEVSTQLRMYGLAPRPGTVLIRVGPKPLNGLWFSQSLAQFPPTAGAKETQKLKHKP